MDNQINNVGQSNTQPVNSQNYYPQQKSSPKGGLFAIIISVIVLVLLAVGLGIYAYYAKLGPFAISPYYTESNLVSGLASAFSKINSASYSVSANLKMANRDADAEPFKAELSNEVLRQYQTDVKRVKDISNWLSSLNSYYIKALSYPVTLQVLQSDSRYKYRNLSVADPAGESYNYRVTDGGKNFALTVTFNTIDAIYTIRKGYQFSDETTKIDGRTVTFTKDSYQYLYMSENPPKPIFVTLGEMLSYVPEDGSASISIGAQSDFTKKDSSDWKFNVDATGDFGDLAYKFNVEALKKGISYYFKINNIPSLFLGYIKLPKNQWIKVTPDEAAQSGSVYGINANQIKQAETSYQENKEELKALFFKIVKVADEEKLIAFKAAPKEEKVGSRVLYKYELETNKEALIPFYKRFIDEVNKSNIKDKKMIAADAAIMEYLQSSDFDKIFDYYKKNTSLTLWVDSRGFPAIVQYGYRVVPQDSVVQLKDKQANVFFKLELSDINKPVNIVAPQDAKDLKEVMAPYQNSRTDSYIKSYLSSAVSNSSYYESKNGNYNKWCTDKQFINARDSINQEYGDGSKVVCNCNTTGCAYAKNWCASALLKSGKYYCVDSSGIRIESQSANVCSAGACR